MIKPVFNIISAEQLGRALIEFGQRANETDVAVNRALSLAIEREIFDEFLA